MREPVAATADTGLDLVENQKNILADLKMTDDTKARLTRALYATLAALAPAIAIAWFIILLFVARALQ